MITDGFLAWCVPSAIMLALVLPDVFRVRNWASDLKYSSYIKRRLTTVVSIETGCKASAVLVRGQTAYHPDSFVITSSAHMTNFCFLFLHTYCSPSNSPHRFKTCTP